MKKPNESRKENALSVIKRDIFLDFAPRKTTELLKHPHLHPMIQSLLQPLCPPTNHSLPIKRQRYSLCSSITKVMTSAHTLPASCLTRRRIFHMPEVHGWGKGIKD